MVAQPANWDVMTTSVIKGITFYFHKSACHIQNLLFTIQFYQSFQGEVKYFFRLS